MKPSLTDADFRVAARILGVPVAAIKAVAEVEAPGSGFLKDGRPRILFERHKFSKHTCGRYDRSHPNISNPKCGGYGKESTQHARLELASSLDRDAALKSASYGRFQILGENYQQAGFATLQGFINAMFASEADQLEAFCNFVMADKAMHSALKHGDWAAFARRYNGPAYAEHGYHTRMADAFVKYSSEPDFTRVTNLVTSTEEPK